MWKVTWSCGTWLPYECSADSSRNSSRTDVGDPRTPPGHPGGRADSDCRECEHRTRQGVLLSEDYAHRGIWVPEHRARELVLGSEEVLEFHTADHATDLYRRTATFSGGTR